MKRWWAPTVKWTSQNTIIRNRSSALSSPPVQIYVEQLLLKVLIKLLIVKEGQKWKTDLILKLSSSTFFFGLLWTSLGFAALASFNKAAIQSVQLPTLCLKYPWREKGPVVDSEKDSTVIQAAGAKDLPSVSIKKTKKTNQILSLRNMRYIQM